MLTALMVPIVRAARLGPFLGACAAGLLIPGVPAVFGYSLDPDSLTLLLRLAAVCAAVGAVFLLDDPAKPTTLVVPARAWVTIVPRLAVAVAVTAVWWLVALGLVLICLDDGTRMRLAGTTLEAATILVAALTFGVVGHRLAERGIGSTAAAPAVLVVVGALAVLPRGIALFVGVEDPRWATVHTWWGVLFLTATAALMIGATNRR